MITELLIIIHLHTTCAASASLDGFQWNNSPPEINSRSSTTVVPVSITLYKETMLGCLNRAKRPASLAKKKKHSKITHCSKTRTIHNVL